MSQTKKIFQCNNKYKWLREPLLERLPDGSLCCSIFTGGRHDSAPGNVVAVIRSDDDGETWSDLEIQVRIPWQACWAPSMFTHKNRTHIFWHVLKKRRFETINHLLSTGDDGRDFSDDRLILQDWNGPNGIDVRHGVQLRDGRVLFPIAWKEPIGDFDPFDKSSKTEAERKRLANTGRMVAYCKCYVGVMEVNDDFTKFTQHGKLSVEEPGIQTPTVPLFENTIAELSDGSLSMLIRGDLTNRLWRSDSTDGGKNWTTPIKTDIPNPGSKPRIINLPDDRIALFHNPSEKDYAPSSAGPHAFRTPLEMWISKDDMKSWATKETLIAAPQLAQYPDGFYDENNQLIYLVWEDDRNVFFKKIALRD
jgi:BNR repeat-like domain